MENQRESRPTARGRIYTDTGLDSRGEIPDQRKAQSMTRADISIIGKEVAPAFFRNTGAIVGYGQTYLMVFLPGLPLDEGFGLAVYGLDGIGSEVPQDGF